MTKKLFLTSEVFSKGVVPFCCCFLFTLEGRRGKGSIV
jgi:hypothetical protein